MVTCRQKQTFQVLEEATSAASGGPLEDRLLAALFWVDLSIQWSHPSSLDAYRKSLELLQVLVFTGSSLESLHYRLSSAVRLKGTRYLAVDAAACAIREGRVEIALELLEQGRSLLLTQTGRYRTPVDDLEAVDPNLADEFRRNSVLIERSILMGGQPSNSMNPPVIDDPVARYCFHSLKKKSLFKSSFKLSSIVTSMGRHCQSYPLRRRL